MSSIEYEKKLDIKRSISKQLDDMGFMKYFSEYSDMIDICFYIWQNPSLTLTAAIEQVAKDKNMEPKLLYNRINGFYGSRLRKKLGKPLGQTVSEVCNVLYLEKGSYRECFCDI